MGTVERNADDHLGRRQGSAQPAPLLEAHPAELTSRSPGPPPQLEEPRQRGLGVGEAAGFGADDALINQLILGIAAALIFLIVIAVVRGERSFLNPSPDVELAAGDRVLVRAGESFPADGVVVDGTTSVDESMLTGEPLPRRNFRGKAIKRKRPRPTHNPQFEKSLYGPLRASQRVPKTRRTERA